MEAINAVPSVPTPAPAVISPVAFSITDISNTFRSGEDPSVIFSLTVSKIPLALILFNDLFTNSALYGSPSSTINSPLITESLVTLLPTILTLSIVNFLPS